MQTDARSARPLKRQRWATGLPSEQDFFDKVLQPTPELSALPIATATNITQATKITAAITGTNQKSSTMAVRNKVTTSQASVRLRQFGLISTQQNVAHHSRRASDVRLQTGAVDEDWDLLKSFFPPEWKQMAKSSGALKSLRQDKSEENCLRVLLLHFGCGLSMRETVVPTASTMSPQPSPSQVPGVRSRAT